MCWHNEGENKVKTKLFLAVREIDMFLNIVMIVFLVSARAEYDRNEKSSPQNKVHRTLSFTEFILSIRVFGM